MDTLSCALFPAPCRACGSPLLRFSLAPVCDFCWNSLSPAPRTWCSLCGEDLKRGAAIDTPLRASVRADGPAPGLPFRDEQLCQLCTKAPPQFRRAVAVAAYGTTLRLLVHSLKYDGMLSIADGLGARLAESILAIEDELPGEMLVVPVPQHASNRRRFNQAELLARAALRELRRQRPGWKLSLAAHLLQRQRATASQAGLSPHERRVNVRGAFSAPNPEGLRGARVLLVDDIYTTGATARACTRALLKAGAESVWVATVARAQFEYTHAQRAAHANQLRSNLPGSDRAGTGKGRNREDGAGQELPMEEDVAFWDANAAGAAAGRLSTAAL